MRFSEWEKDVAPKLMAAVTAAGDNKDAFNYLTQQGYCIRIFDNLYDQDYPPTREELLDVVRLLFSADISFIFPSISIHGLSSSSLIYIYIL